jgi:Uncharacterized protein conserved in bacteria (DUF2334)
VKAQYLLRFDDLCPTMNRARWRRFAGLIDRFGIKPILAVVPDNRDPELEVDAFDSEFWGEMRRLEANGAIIGLHGFRHLCNSDGRSLVPLHSRTEFAGVAREEQRDWIREGLVILREQGLTPRIWVAPRHGFDAATLGALNDEGIELVSDGFAAGPFLFGGLRWIPQQLWGPAERRRGLWTICLHANTAPDEDFRGLEGFLEGAAERFTSVDRVLEEWTIGSRSAADRIFHFRMMTRIRLRRYMRQRIGG